MTKEVYEAISRLVSYASTFQGGNIKKDIEIVDGWLDEVKKEVDND